MSAQTMEKVVVKAVFDPGARMTACDFLAAKSGLSKGRVKDAMNKGAAWIRKKGGGMRRLRRATALPDAGDRLELYYDGKLLSVKPPAAKCLSDKRRYSVWYKPAGLLAQGTMYGDHCSLERQAELFFKSAREVYLVHRLDREAEGLMLLAHDKNAAARLSELFQKDMIAKKYRLEVLGDLAVKGKQGTIELPLDGKHALSMYEVESYHRESNTTTVSVTIKTGRLHQIRRHFDMIGFPVMGDPRYGRGNKNTAGMRLSAVSLRFICPFAGREVEFSMPQGDSSRTSAQ